MGAPFANVNRVVHGGRSKRFGLVHAKLGKRFASQYGDLNRLRRVVEALVGLADGGLEPRERVLLTAKVQSMIRAEEGARACELMIRQTPVMSAEEVRQQRHAIREFSRERDKLLGELLGNGQGTDGDPATLYQTVGEGRTGPVADDDSEHVQARENATDAIVGGDSDGS